MAVDAAKLAEMLSRAGVSEQIRNNIPKILYRGYDCEIKNGDGSVKQDSLK